ncbi:hypothetical protein LXL04_019091 [Taraxacum kok-saghyz]
MSGGSGCFDDINAMFFLVDAMPSAIGEYMSMMLFESDEDQYQPLEDESDEGADLEEDDLVDEENNVPEVEVDMADFTLNLDGDESNTDRGDADEEIDEDLDVIDNERWDSLDEGSDDDIKRRNVLKNLAKEKRCNLGNVHKASFYVGQKFKSKKELKDLIDDHAIQTRRNLYFEKNDKLRLRAKCRGVVVGSLSSRVVGTSKSNDKCVNSKEEGCKWALHASRTNEESDWFVKTLKDNHSCLKSRKLRACTATFLSKEILCQIETDPRVPLRALVEQIESKYEVGVSMDKIFRAKAAATKIVVGDYTKQYEILRDYCLELQATNPDTTIKIDVYSEPNPSNPTRMDYLWKCVTATTIPEFEHFMSEFSSYDKAASEWLKKIPPKQWARSHFTGRAITDILLNNLCEVFNSKLIDGRDKPIIGCLEYIRQYLMKRICNVMKVMDKATRPLTPTATSILEANTSHASKYKARWNGGDKYQVTGVWQDQHVVDVRNNNCSCRKWELIGIPCKHAIATLNEMTKNSEDVTNIYRWVNKVYWLDTWKEAYSYKVHPIKERIMWPKSLCSTKLTPPPHHTQVGRPKKKRNKTEDERMSRSQRGSYSQATNQDEGIRVGKDGAKKLTRKYGKVTCSKCKNTGHNARSCTGR